MITCPPNFHETLDHIFGFVGYEAVSTTPSKPSPLSLQEKGWSLRTAAKALGVNFSHLHRVVKGERQSASLLRRAQALPQRQSHNQHR